MNDKIVETVKTKMKSDGITQAVMADRLGMARTNLVRLVNGHIGSVPKRWQDVLNELGLEVIAVPKDADVSEPEQKMPVETAATEPQLDVSQDDTKGSVKRAVPIEIPPEVAELRRRWKAGEFKGKDTRTPGGMWFGSTAHTEMGHLFGALEHKHKPRRKAAVEKLLAVAALNPKTAR